MRVRSLHRFLSYQLSADKLVINYYDTIEDRRVVSNVEPGYLKKLLPDGPPQDGEPWAEIQKDIESKILPGITHWYFFWIEVAILANAFQGSHLISWLSSQPTQVSQECLEISILALLQVQRSTGYALLRSPS
jgi:hypothetical protein